MFSIVTFLVGVYVGQEYPNFPNVKSSISTVHNYFQSTNLQNPENSQNQQVQSPENSQSPQNSFDIAKVLELLFGKRND